MSERTPAPLPSRLNVYVATMQRFPRLSEAQTQVALVHLRAGKSVDQLRLAFPPSGPYTELFREAKQVEQVIGLGRFDLIEKVAGIFSTFYPLVDVEAFMQEAVIDVIPAALRTYDPQQGSLENYLFRALKLDMLDRINGQTRRQSLAAGRKGLPRRPIVSLEQLPCQHDEDGETPQMSVVDREAEEPYESLARISALEQVYRSAVLEEYERNAVTHLVINEEPQKTLAQQRRVTARTLRLRRDHGIKKIQALGLTRVRAIFRGEGR